ncbi:unnamed protein product, partial [Mesorhabditis spiculigera]
MAESSESRLRQLMVGDEEDMDSEGNRGGDADTNGDDEAGELLPNTGLGRALDGLLTSWTSLLSNTATHRTPQATTIDHVKEVSEINVKNFRDACQEVNAEFAKISVQWFQEHPEEAEQERIKNLDAAIARQATLFGRIPGVTQRRVEEYTSTGQQQDDSRNY